MLNIGVLAVQGSFAEHISMLNQISGESEQSGLSAVLKPHGFTPNGVSKSSGAFKSSNEFKGALKVREIRQLADIHEPLDGLVLPGGESTTMGKLLKDLGLYEPLRERIAVGLPVFGTCAGAILLARELVNDSTRHFGLLDVAVERNAYGRQLGSFECMGEFKGVGEVDMVFVRAPIFASVGQSVQVLSVVNERIVAVRQGAILATSYHPELTNDARVHEYFLKICKSSRR